MPSESPANLQRLRLGEDCEFDPTTYELLRLGRVQKLERIPAEILFYLIEQRGQVVSRDQIVKRIWGEGIFLDTDNSINGAIRKIRQALKDSPENPTFVQTLTGRGYRYIGPINDQQEKEDAGLETEAILAATPTSVATEGPPPPRDLPESVGRFSKGMLLATAALLILAVVGLILILPRTKRTTQSAIRSLAVLPLKNLSGDPTQEYLADGLTETLIGSLAGIHDLRVISRTSSMHFKNTQLEVPEIAKQLGVEAVVEGSVIRDGSRIRVHAQLIRAATDEHFWAQTYDRELKDLLALESDVAQSIADKVQITITGQERQRLASVPSVSPEVYQNYLQGIYALDKSKGKAETEISIGYLQKAIEMDPTFAPAYLELAGAYGHLSSVFGGIRPEEVRPKERQAVEKALELDPQSADAHAMLGSIEQIQWNWAEAEREFRRALQLRPDDSYASIGLAGWMACQGRFDEAIPLARHARELEPFAVSGDSIAWILFLAHRFPEAIEESRSWTAVRPDAAQGHWHLGYALIANGQAHEAIPVLEKALSLSERSSAVMAVLARAYAHAGRREDALRLIAELNQRRRSGYVPAGAMLNAYLGIDDREKAFFWLGEAYKEHSNILQFLTTHPHFDPLRNDPRFRDFVHRVGLDAPAAGNH